MQSKYPIGMEFLVPEWKYKQDNKCTFSSISSNDKSQLYIKISPEKI